MMGIFKNDTVIQVGLLTADMKEANYHGYNRINLTADDVERNENGELCNIKELSFAPDRAGGLANVVYVGVWFDDIFLRHFPLRESINLLPRVNTEGTPVKFAPGEFAYIPTKERK